MSHQKGRGQVGLLVAVLYAPSESDDAEPFKLDSGKPSPPTSSCPPRRVGGPAHRPCPAATLAELAQADADERYRYYSQLAGIHRSVPHVHHEDGVEATTAAGRGRTEA
ncbi:MAG: hypothetical protein U0869_19965 [Chloroflexota bacterium]